MGLRRRCRLPAGREPADPGGCFVERDAGLDGPAEQEGGQRRRRSGHAVGDVARDIEDGVRGQRRIEPEFAAHRRDPAVEFAHIASMPGKSQMRRPVRRSDNLAVTGCVYRVDKARGGAVTVVDADFATFVRANERALLRLAWLLMADAYAAEDLVQTALEKTLPKWASIRHDDPMAYLYRVMLNTRTSWWRRHRGREAVSSEVAEGAVSDATDSFAERDRMTIALRNLTEGQRKVVVLRHYEDLSEAQVAALLGCSVGTVKSQNARGLARLREALDESGTDRRPAAMRVAQPNTAHPNVLHEGVEGS
jgi:RNA polymerase sigma-70 factor (sigma-E family)